jgi:hypothetical protein
MGDLPGAVDDATEALKLDKSQALAYLNRGVARYGLSRQKPPRESAELLRQAEADLKGAIEHATPGSSTETAAERTLQDVVRELRSLERQ